MLLIRENVTPEREGWRRLPKHDTERAEAWLTPNQQIYLHPKSEGVLKLKVARK